MDRKQKKFHFYLDQLGTVKKQFYYQMKISKSIKKTKIVIKYKLKINRPDRQANETY